LGLADRAAKEFDIALRNPKLSLEQRVRTILSRGIIDFQEQRYLLAAQFAEKATQILQARQLDQTELAGRAWLLWGEALAKQGSFGEAENRYHNAITTVEPEMRGETYYLLGQCQFQLGKFDDAKESFEHVPLKHDRTGQTIRYLAKIALHTRHYADAEFWLKKGRAEYSEQFLDSWVDFALGKSAQEQGNDSAIRQVVDGALQRYGPSDGWVTLLEAQTAANDFSGATK
jgi:tetratricopeptide (TPR) repeat protein